MGRMSGQALFLDRDGTLMVDAHHVHKPDDVVLLPGVKESLARVLELGYQLFLFTNQSGIGRGFFALEDAVACNEHMVELLGLGPDLFTDICIAPEHPDDAPVYRKPNPRFILESIEKHGLDPARCYMVGDRRSDWETGLNAGIRAVAVETGKPIDDDLSAFMAQKGVVRYADFPAFVTTL